MKFPKYIYLGDKNTEANYAKAICEAVRRPDGKCIRGKNGNMLVTFNLEPVVVVARLLRKIKRDE